MSLKINQSSKFTKSFKKLYKKYKKLTKDYRKLLLELEDNNIKTSIDLGDNFYKIRLQNTSNNKGKKFWF